MKIIEEMRAWASDLRYDGWETTPAMINKWADYLERSGALVPVPDGGVKSFLFACEDQCEYVRWNGKVCRIDSLQEGVDVVGANRNYPIANAIGVQPVRLVPITEAQIDE